MAYLLVNVSYNTHAWSNMLNSKIISIISKRILIMPSLKKNNVVNSLPLSISQPFSPSQRSSSGHFFGGGSHGWQRCHEVDTAHCGFRCGRFIATLLLAQALVLTPVMWDVVGWCINSYTITSTSSTYMYIYIYIIYIYIYVYYIYIHNIYTISSSTISASLDLPMPQVPCDHRPPVLGRPKSSWLASESEHRCGSNMLWLEKSYMVWDIGIYVWYIHINIYIYIWCI